MVIALERHYPTSRDRFRQQITQAATSTRLAETTNLFTRNLRHGRTIRDSRQRADYQIRTERLLEQRWASGQFSALDHFDFEQFQRDALGTELLRAISAREEQYRHARLQERVMDAMTSDNFLNTLQTQIRFGVIERAEHAPTPLTSIVDRNIRLGPFPTKLVRTRNVNDVTGDCSGELEETQFVGVPGQPLISVPEACKKKFAAAYTREMADVDINGAIRNQIDQLGDSLNLHAEKLLVDLMFGLYDTSDPSLNMFPFIEDDVQFHTYYAVGASGPWENDVSANALDGTFQPFETLERLFELKTDPYSGEPVQRSGNDRVVVPNRTSAQLAAQGLGVFQVERNLSNPADGLAQRLTFNRNPDFNVGGEDIVMSRYIRPRLIAWYKTTAGGGLNQTQAEAAADGTWLYGDTSAAFGWGTQWDREKMEIVGRDTWQNFNQEVLAVMKWMEKTTPVNKMPEECYRSRA